MTLSGPRIENVVLLDCDFVPRGLDLGFVKLPENRTARRKYRHQTAARMRAGSPVPYAKMKIRR